MHAQGHSRWACQARRAATVEDALIEATVGTATRACPQGGVKAGRPDVAATLAGAAAREGAGPVGVYACGPAQMLDDTRDAVAKATAAAPDASKRFLLHTEVFLF